MLVRGMVLAAVAIGAVMVVFFLWLAAVFGANDFFTNLGGAVVLIGGAYLVALLAGRRRSNWLGRHHLRVDRPDTRMVRRLPRRARERSPLMAP